MSRQHDSFTVISINHEIAPLEVRERYSLDDAKVEALYAQLHANPQISESLILNTCNRFELYTECASEASERFVLQELAKSYGVEIAELEQHLHLRSGREAVQHLIEVSAGLRSQITGEAEIFGQVKAAYAVSQDNGYAGKTINRVFQKGFQAAKLIRNSTSVGEGQINIANVAVDLAGKIFGELNSAAALSLGTGEIGEKTVKALRSRGAKTFGIASRSQARAEAVAQEWGGTPRLLQDLETYLPEYDIVIASVGAEEAVITRKIVKNCFARRKGRPLFLIDLGLPRNIEQCCEDFDNIFLYNLDDLATIADENLAQRKQAVVDATAIAAQKSEFIWNAILKRREYEQKQA
ncbi:glutamyl-tRNA reductase [Pelagicoccus sp. SDUM812005]|uniref:glutamyl-tRNA reductase n=1 Tax=Pelagicoccus sp. SDUM812005 TaxID=3041257 RepID=UPI00280D76FA|nr:glutamyl-tRNA reductase [Pelagicoccus sp. SDUM812005]MDQ8179417.1 glutamyl-tRNA reductase [Pelagicoccus sp. SDUM812005]